MGILLVLTEDGDRLSQIETDVNANRVAMGLEPFAGGDIIAGCVQVGLNAITDGRDVPNTLAMLPELNITGLPGASDNVAFSDELDARIASIATALGQSETNVTSLALHAGCLVMVGEATSGYRASFGE